MSLQITVSVDTRNFRRGFRRIKWAFFKLKVALFFWRLSREIVT